VDLARVGIMIMISTYNPGRDQEKVLQNIAFKAKLKAVRASMERAANNKKGK
jgi:hypothetical protein